MYSNIREVCWLEECCSHGESFRKNLMCIAPAGCQLHQDHSGFNVWHAKSGTTV